MDIYQYMVTITALLICSFTDIRFRRVYRVVLTGYLILAVLGHLTGTLLGRSVSAEEIIAGMIPGIFCLILSFFTKQSLGYGDSILIVLCGLSLGFQMCFSLTLTAFFWSGIWALLIWRMGKADRKGEIPFVPFLLLGMMIQIAGSMWQRN